MKSVWRKVDRLLSDKGGLSEDEIVDEIENGGEDINERLAEQGLTREEMLILAEETRKAVTDIARAEGLNRFELPYIWIDLISLCNGENGITAERVKILLWLLAGGRLAIKERPDDDMLTQEDIENEIISVGLCYKQMCDYFDNIRALCPKYADILIALDGSGFEAGDENTEFEEVFKLLVENGYADKYEDKGTILNDNLAAVSAQISAMPFLEPIKPLVYFILFVKYQKKMQQNSGFIPDIRKAFNQRTAYEIYNDNGKNFKQNALYCDLYADLKKIFGSVDKELCDFGFLLSSNLANWRWMAGFLGYDCLGVTEDIPISANAFVYENLPACFDEFPYEKTGISAEKFYKCEDKYKLYELHWNTADRIANCLEFEELERFAADPRGFCTKIWTDEYIKLVNEKNFEASWCIVIDTVRSKFNGMLLDELAYILNVYFLKILT